MNHSSVLQDWSCPECSTRLASFAANASSLMLSGRDRRTTISLSSSPSGRRTSLQHTSLCEIECVCLSCGKVWRPYEGKLNLSSPTSSLQWAILRSGQPQAIGEFSPGAVRCLKVISRQAELSLRCFLPIIRPRYFVSGAGERLSFMIFDELSPNPRIG